jgi:hypothetical protein
MTITKNISDEEKIKLDIYVPLSVCACQWENFMNLIFRVITDYSKYIKFETKDLNSEEARNLNLHGNCVVIDGVDVVNSSFALKKKLPIILKDKGLI